MFFVDVPEMSSDLGRWATHDVVSLLPLASNYGFRNGGLAWEV